MIDGYTIFGLVYKIESSYGISAKRSFAVVNFV